MAGKLPGLGSWIGVRMRSDGSTSATCASLPAADVIIP